MSVFCEGMGVATGITFDGDGNLYVGDRSGTIFKISPDRQIYVFATMEASIAISEAASPDSALIRISLTSTRERAMPSANIKPRASSMSSPGVRITTESG